MLVYKHGNLRQFHANMDTPREMPKMKCFMYTQANMVTFPGKLTWMTPDVFLRHDFFGGCICMRIFFKLSIVVRLISSNFSKQFEANFPMG